MSTDIPNPADCVILIVEDSSTQALLLQNVLESNGFKAPIARHGEEAIKMLQKQHPAAVVTDINMPGMDGYTLCHRIKTDPQFKNIPVLLLTSLSSPQDVIRGLECCADNFIVKPFDRADLLRRLRFSLANRSSSASPCADTPITINFGGRNYVITADRPQILYFLLSTYETVLQQNTALITARENLEHSTRDLKRSNEDLEQFSYVASHDLQEPLRMVTSYMGLLHKRYHSQLDETALGFINFAIDGAKRMQNLIQDLLAYSRVKTRGGELKETNLEHIIDAITANLSIAIQECGAVVTHDPLPVIRSDTTQMTQLLQNLVGNALKFRSQNPVIHVSAVRKQGHWQFGVHDNGIGIAPEFFDRVFAVFQRLHTAREYPGTGIGLSICKKIVERHGGRIWVESKPGEGTTFFFTIADNVAAPHQA